MAVGAILTLGFGSFGDVTQVVTLGYSSNNAWGVIAPSESTTWAGIAPSESTSWSVTAPSENTTWTRIKS